MHTEVQTPRHLPAKPSPMQRGTRSRSWSRSLAMKRYGNSAAPSIPRRGLASSHDFFHHVRSRKTQAGNNAIGRNYFSKHISRCHSGGDLDPSAPEQFARFFFPPHKSASLLKCLLTLLNFIAFKTFLRLLMGKLRQGTRRDALPPADLKAIHLQQRHASQGCLASIPAPELTLREPGGKRKLGIFFWWERSRTGQPQPPNQNLSAKQQNDVNLISTPFPPPPGVVPRQDFGSWTGDSRCRALLSTVLQPAVKFQKIGAVRESWRHPYRQDGEIFFKTEGFFSAGRLLEETWQLPSVPHPQR